MSIEQQQALSWSSGACASLCAVAAGAAPFHQRPSPTTRRRRSCRTELDVCNLHADICRAFD